jgi:serine phosphatase RsbU (regulator of sigma subunit)
MLPLKTTGLPLGMLEMAEYEVETLRMKSGDKIVAYSDGLSEAQNAEGAFFETSRMQHMIAANAGRSAAEIHQALMQQVESFTQGTVQHDDITALVMEFRG